MQTEDSAKSTAFKYLTVTGTIGALIIRIGFWGPVYYNIYKEPPGPFSSSASAGTVSGNSGRAHKRPFTAPVLATLTPQ